MDAPLQDMLITGRTPGLEASPSPDDMVHVVLVVLPATEATEAATIDRVTDMLRYTRPRGRNMNEKAHRHHWLTVDGALLIPLLLDIRTVIAVTKVDSIDSQLAAKPELIGESKPVAAICEKVAAACGVPLRDVFPIKNYNSEAETNFALETPVLKILVHAQRAAKALLRVSRARGS